MAKPCLGVTGIIQSPEYMRAASELCKAVNELRYYKFLRTESAVPLLQRIHELSGIALRIAQALDAEL